MAKKTQLIRELEAFLTPEEIEQLRTELGLPGDVNLCIPIADILVQYTDNENEYRISQLLSQLCKKHFYGVR